MISLSSWKVIDFFNYGYQTFIYIDSINSGGPSWMRANEDFFERIFSR